MSTTPPVIEARGACISAGANVLLRDIDLTIHAGERVAILGHNGAGKSTLLRAMTGFNAVTQGSFRVLGNEMNATLHRRAALTAPNPSSPLRLQTLRSHIAQVHQGLHLVGRLRAVDNVLIGGAARASPLQRWLLRWASHERDAAQHALARVGMAWAHARRTDSLSGGERQKVAIARALHQQAPIMLADEPTANLDADAATEIVELITGVVAERKSTLLTVVHDLDRVAQLANRVIVLRRGQVVADGAVAQYSVNTLRSLLK